MTVYKSNIQDFRVVKDGTDGEDGVGIVSIVEYYAVSASSSIPPTIWETTVPEMTETNCYLWNYSITTYTKGDSTESDPRVIGTYSKNGEDGVGIASITEYYALSRSNTIIDGGSWQTEVPTMTAELKYLWSYEVISYTDGTDYSTSQRVIGVYGDNFTWNLVEGTSSDWVSFTVLDQDNFYVYPFYFAEMNDGSVSAGDRLQLSLYLKFGDDFAATSTGTSTMYLQGTMNYGGTWESISITGGRWDTELQDILNSDSREGYLTTYIDITSAMVDGTYSGKWTIGLRFNYYAGTAYCKCAMANIGSSPATWAPAVTEIYGNDGVGISNVVNYYLATNESSDVTIDTEGWTDTVQSVSEDAKYLWNYEVVVYTNGNYTTTDPCIIGSYGEDGKGIVSIVEYYALTQSISTPEDSAWQTEIPVMTSDWKYLWNYEAITYTDSDEPEITEAKIIGVYGDAGKDGADGTSVNILGTAYTAEDEYSEGSLYTLYYDEDLSTPIENAEAGDAYLVNGYLFVYAELDEAFTCAGVIQGVGIESVVNYYLATDIATGITSENYSDYTWTTEPTGITENKKYLWNYEVIYYTDGSETMTPPCVIGAYGSDGRGIVSIVEYYALTQDTTEPSSDSWQTDVPTMTAEWKYLWNYEAITYTDSNIPETTDAKIIGVYGEDGSDGISITNVVNYYLATDQSSGIKTTTSGWTTTVQSISEEKQYLWNYEVVEYSEGDPTTTDPCIIGYFGTDGVGIVSIVEYYALSSDSETVPTEWQVGDSDNPPPSMDAINRYLWNYEKITYSDGTVDTGGKKIIGVYSVDGVGISSITEYYAVSSSNTTAPSTWYTSVQTMDSTNKYLWNYEIIEYTDGTSTYTSKRVIGTYSVDGTDGVGISGITEYYAVSSSNSTAPTSWSTSVQTMTTTNKYLWNYEVITYTDNTTSSTSKRVIGVYGNTGAAGADGEDGTDGVGISSITNYYLRSSSSSGVTASTSGWTTTIQTITTTYKYLWNYEVVAYTDGTSYTSTPCIIGVYGNTGATGADGIGISGITEYYAVSSSNSSAPTSWSTSVQTMTATNKYLWNYEVVLYTDGTTSSTDKRVIGVYGADGEDGEDGVGIKSITNYYLRSTSSSGITTSTSGWSTTVPTITTTYKYLWNYEVVAYTDGTSYTSTPCIIGVYGNTGATGADGVGISSIVNYYLVTSASSGVTISTSGWTTTIQTVTTTKKYLWNYEVITYTEGDPYTSTPCIIGVYGDTGAAGADGVSMTSVTEYYAVSSSPSTTPTSWVEGSSGNIPSMTVTNRYLWNYEVVNYSDGTSTKGSAKVIGVYGNTGDAGEDGRSIQSIETQYYLSTSSTSQAGGSWVSYLPEWKEGYYIWSRSYIIWEDGGDYTYTTPVLMAGLNTISETVSTVSANFTVLEDNITSAVEGVTTTVNNLADTVSNTTTWNLATGTSDEWKSFTVTDITNATCYPFYFYDMNDSNLTTDDYISVSVDVKFSDNFVASGTGTAGMYLQGDMNHGGTWNSISLTGGNKSAVLLEILNSDSRQARISTYFKVTSSMIDGTYSGSWKVGFRFNYYTGTFYYKCAMANLGKTAIAWSPAYSEIALQSSITTIQNQYSEVIQTIDGISSEVGDITTVLNGDGEEVGLVSQVSTLTQTADSIALNVSSVQTQLDGLSVGGRNYLTGTKDFDSGLWKKSSNVTLAVDDEGYTVATWAEVTSLAWNNIKNTGGAFQFSQIRDKEVTVSLDVRSDDYESLNADSSHGLVVTIALCTASSTSRTLYRSKAFYTTNLSDEWERISYTITASDSYFSSGSGTIDDTTRCYLQIYDYSLYSMEVRKVKLETGNVATDWSPAPEDAETYTDEAIEASLVLYLDDDGVAHLTANADSIELSAGQLIINSGNFTLDANGTMTCINGYFSGTITADRGTIGGWVITDTRIKTSSTVSIAAEEQGMLLINEEDNPYIHVQDSTGHCTFQILRTGDVYLDSIIYMYDSNYDYWTETYGSSPYYSQYTKALYYTYQEGEVDEEDGTIIEDPWYCLTIGQMNDFVYIPGGIVTNNNSTMSDIKCTGDMRCVGDLTVQGTLYVGSYYPVPCIQKGKILQTLTATSGTISVTFDEAFSSEPTVVVSPRHQSSLNITARVYSKSTTGFVIYYTAGNTGNSPTFEWIAMC